MQFERLAILSGHEPKRRGLLAPGSPANLQPRMQEFVRTASAPGVEKRGQAAIIRLDAPLMCETDWLSEWGLCLSHEGVSQALTALAADASVSTVVLDMHCAGWGVAGSSQTKEALAKVKAEGKRLIAYGRDLIASGGVYMATFCDETVLSPTAMMGSIGTLILGYDTSQAYAEAGIKPVVIASDADKAVGNAGVPYTESAIANLQKMVEADSAEFFAAVSKARGIPVDSIRAMKAGMFGAGDALSMRLADSVQSPEEFFARVAKGAGSRSGGGSSPVVISPTGGNRQEKRMEFGSLTVADLRANCGTLVEQIEKSAVETAAKAANEAASAPATYQELKARFAGDSEFIVECQEAGRSIGQAVTAHATRLAARLAATEKQAAEQAAKIAELEKRKATTNGADPLPSGNVAGPGAATRHEFLIECDKAMALNKKLSLGQAMGQVARSNPALHQKFVADGAAELKARAVKG